MRLSLFALSALAVLVFSTSALSAADLLPPDMPIEQAIDHYIDGRLQKEGVSAAPHADDANLLRRTMLDLAGRIPTPIEAKAYIASADGDKRLKMVESLMASPAFIRQQAAEFDALLMDGTKQSLREYLAKAFQDGRSWDRMFREMIVGEPDDTKQQGAIRFVASRVKDQDRLANDASVLFFGVNVSCAKCHDHPLVADWTQDHYYGMLSFFSRTFEVGEHFGERDYGMVNYKTVEGESRDARLMFLTGTVVAEPPAPEPDAQAKKDEKKLIDELKKKKEAPPAPTFSRRARLVDAALSDDENQFFARAIVNHLWNRLLGRGLVMPVDQMHSESPPSHPELLEWLARDMKSHGYDLRRLMRGIVLSGAYARSSRWDSADERPADELFAVGLVRPLKPWQYGTSLRLATSNPDSFSDAMKPDELDRRIAGLESAGRSLTSNFEVPGSDFQVSVDEALLFSNNERVASDLLREAKETLVGKLAEITDPQQVVETAVWSIMARSPSDEETKVLTEYLAKRGDKAADARRQMVWALLTSSECRFNY